VHHHAHPAHTATERTQPSARLLALPVFSRLPRHSRRGTMHRNDAQRRGWKARNGEHNVNVIERERERGGGGRGSARSLMLCCGLARSSTMPVASGGFLSPLGRGCMSEPSKLLQFLARHKVHSESTILWCAASREFTWTARRIPRICWNSTERQTSIVAGFSNRKSWRNVNERHQFCNVPFYLQMLASSWK